jgi:hypothetical protein
MVTCAASSVLRPGPPRTRYRRGQLGRQSFFLPASENANPFFKPIIEFAGEHERSGA